MTPLRPRRRALLLAGVAAAVLGLAGCGQTRYLPGSAALVGDTRISVDELHTRVSAALADPAARQRLAATTAAQAEFQRVELSRLIDHELLTAAAARKGVSVTPAMVDERIDGFESQAGSRAQLEQQAAAGGVPADQLRGFVSDLVLADRLGEALVADVPVTRAQLEQAYRANIDTYDQVHTAHILVADKATADKLLAAVRANPSRFGELAAQFSTDPGSKSQGGDLGFQGRGAFVEPFSQAVFAAKPGTFLEVKTQFGYHVVRVIERRTRSLDAVRAELRRTILKPAIDQRLPAYLAEVGRDLGIRVSPRFGTWDAAAAKVVPARATLSTPQPGTGGQLGVPPTSR